VYCWFISLILKHLRNFFIRYKAGGIRLDSGDLAYLSIETRKFFYAIEKEFGVPSFGKTNITASNDLNEETIDALNKQVSSTL
jgi:nicotinate phosphoribosyltransferase